MTNNNKLPVSGTDSHRSLYGAISVLAISVMVTAGAFFLNEQQSSLYQPQKSHADELRVLPQQIASNAQAAAKGRGEAFSLLKSASDQFNSHLQEIARPPAAALFSNEESSHSIEVQTESIQSAWAELQNDINLILASEEAILSLHALVSTLNDTLPQLQIEYDEVLEVLLANGVSPDQIAIVQRQPWLAERILRSLSSILTGGEDSIMAADSFDRDIKLFGRVLTGMQQGSSAMGVDKVTDQEAVDRLIEIADMFAYVESRVDEILGITPELSRIRIAVDNIETDARQLLQQTSILANSLGNSGQQSQLLTSTIKASSIIALLALIATLFLLKTTRRRVNTGTPKNETNQTAIIRLLDEIAELANGDLRVHASVTEGFTGAIANSLNLAVEQLRSLVGTINQTATQVDTAVRETQATAEALADNTEEQLNDINITTRSLHDIASTMSKVSTNASNSVQIAEHSVQLAANGEEIMQNSIKGMNIIQEQLQDASQHIKQLGESSREISHIVALVNDIASHSQVLSINASIQASSGDAGRGFAVVADEVQRLAERISSATGQIESLATHIQADSDKAVLSMEQASADIAQGSQLAQNAGDALEEVKQASNNLASLVHEISDTTEYQASVTSEVSSRMMAIQDMTSQASVGSASTAKSINDLVHMAHDMRQSVASFKLPDTAS